MVFAKGCHCLNARYIKRYRSASHKGNGLNGFALYIVCYRFMLPKRQNYDNLNLSIVAKSIGD
jgi:hypothetical protein